MTEFMDKLNQIVAKELGYSSGGKAKGTSYWYTQGSVGRKSVQMTHARTNYNGRFGFWSWIATKYKNGTTKRTKFALSANRKQCEKRADKLLKQLEEKYGR